MNSFNTKFNDVELSMPLNAVYVSTARTTASSIAEKMNFSSSKVEDIKAAVSEAVTYLINNSNLTPEDSSFKIKFIPDNNDLKVEINSSVKVKDDSSNISLSLVEGFMDDFKIDYSNKENLCINMLKKN